MLRGTKAWISHAAHASYYTTFARTGAADSGSKGISCFLVPGDATGLSFAPPEDKMGLHCDPVAQVIYEDVAVDADRLIGAPGQGLPIALSALDSGRLGIAAAATGLGQAALNVAARYAAERDQFGKPIASFQGLAFLLADMQAAVASSSEAAIAKLTATDAAMRVTTDAIQVLGGAGYTTDFPVERYFRDAKVTQIFEGTNQIQRLVISRNLMAAVQADGAKG